MPFTDWNQYLAAKDEPAQDEFAPMPDPMATFQMPAPGTVRPEQIGKAIDFMYSLRKHQQESRVAAQRWKGQQDFKRLFQQYSTEGDPETAARKALLGSAPDMFAGDPTRTATTLYNLSKPRTPMGVPGTVSPIHDETGRTIAHSIIGPTGKATIRSAGKDPLDSVEMKEADEEMASARHEWNTLKAEQAKGLADVDTASATARKLLILQNETIPAINAKRRAIAQGIGRTGPLPGQTGVPVPPRPGVAAPGTEEPTQEELRRAAGVKPTALPKSAAAAGVRVRRKGDKKEFTYHGNAADVPKDKFDILP